MKITVDNKDYDSENLSDVSNKAVAKLQTILKKEQELNSDYEDLQLVNRRSRTNSIKWGI